MVAEIRTQQVAKTVSLPGPFNKYRAHLGLKVFNLTNHFQPEGFPEQPGE